MELVTYVRRQPWRPRSPWLGVRAGERRRGFRQDELASIPDELQDGVDVILSVTGEAELDGAVLAEEMSTSAVHGLVPARVDISGLQAIAALAPERFSSPPEVSAFPAVDWHAFGGRSNEERRLSRDSA